MLVWTIWQISCLCALCFSYPLLRIPSEGNLEPALAQLDQVVRWQGFPWWSNYIFFNDFSDKLILPTVKMQIFLRHGELPTRNLSSDVTHLRGKDFGPWSVYIKLTSACSKLGLGRSVSRTMETKSLSSSTSLILSSGSKMAPLRVFLMSFTTLGMIRILRKIAYC